MTDVEMHPISPQRPPTDKHMHHGFDAILVSRLSIKRWWALESSISTSFTKPRIVVSSWPTPWPDNVVHDLGFDGWMHLNLAAPPWNLMKVARETIVAARTRGTRVPSTHNEPAELPLTFDITRGDQMNTNILTLLAFGLSDKDIAAALCLAPHTIRNRVSRMLRESGFESRTALSLYYLRLHRLKLQRELIIDSQPETTRPMNRHNSALSS